MSSTTITMKAVHYEKPFEVSVKEVSLPKIEHPDDAIIKVTTAGTTGASLSSQRVKSLTNWASHLRLRLAYVR